MVSNINIFVACVRVTFDTGNNDTYNPHKSDFIDLKTKTKSNKLKEFPGDSKFKELKIWNIILGMIKGCMSLWEWYPDTFHNFPMTWEQLTNKK